MLNHDLPICIMINCNIKGSLMELFFFQVLPIFPPNYFGSLVIVHPLLSVSIMQRVRWINIISKVNQLAHHKNKLQLRKFRLLQLNLNLYLKNIDKI
jgi:hypothetical protein